MVSDIDELAYEFFQEFARCEYCLKAVGLREASRDAKASWGAFANEVRATLENPSSAALAKAIAYYLGNPPKKQVVENGCLKWDATLPGHANNAELP